jgi:UDP-glucose 4-epimerase
VNETILVTGGAGFIGTWVLRELIARGACPIAFDVQRNEDRWQRILGPERDRVVFEPGSLTDLQRLADVCATHQVTGIIHLGALLTPACQADPWQGCQVNVLGTVAVFEQARARPQQIKSISFASSLAVYGPEPDDVLTDSPSDIDATGAPNFYGAYKRCAELIARQYWQHFQIPSFGLRPHVVYGPERTVGLTAGPSLAARAAARGESFQIDYTGPAGYDFVEDVARAFVRGALETPHGCHVVDLPSQEATTDQIVELLTCIVPSSAGRLTTHGGPIPVNKPGAWQFITQLFPDWQATTLADGLTKTVAFYR